VVCTAAEVRAQLEYVDRFHRRRLRRSAARGDLRDRSDFTQDYATDILSCASCGLVYRRDQPRATTAVATYASDRYGRERLEALFASQVELFRPRAIRLASMVRKNGRIPVVIEIGSFVGGFLTAATELGWNAIGIDPGREVGEFCRAKGLTVVEAAGDQAMFNIGCADAVVVWNTFDQLPNPQATLEEARRWLHSDGIFALRLPNGASFHACMQRLRRLPAAASAPLRIAMAWNNLLGFPYLHGYSPETVDRLLVRFALRQVTIHPSVLPRLADATTKWWAVREEQLVKSVWRALTRLDARAAPWFDAYYTASSLTREAAP
jgi:SAM-dependent methyltransferase